MNLSPEDVVDLLLVFAVGALVGTGELVSRFRDEPRRAVFSIPGFLYLAVNGAASAFALIALRTFGWLPDSATPEQTRLLQILAAGIGAMAIFRTAVFTVRVSNTDIGVGPVAFLQIMLAALDRAVDRKRARERAQRVIEIMDGLTFDQLVLALPPFSVALMQNLSPEETIEISGDVESLMKLQMPPEAKILNLGLLMMNYVGEGVLDESVLGLRTQLNLPPPKRRRTMFGFGPASSTANRPAARQLDPPPEPTNLATGVMNADPQAATAPASSAPPANRDAQVDHVAARTGPDPTARRVPTPATSSSAPPGRAEGGVASPVGSTNEPRSTKPRSGRRSSGAESGTAPAPGETAHGTAIDEPKPVPDPKS